jgi:two-component system CheB/CheR fusion protein
MAGRAGKKGAVKIALKPAGKKGGASTADVSLYPNRKPQKDTGFPIIGIGASAGGLEAFELFFRNMPARSGMAFLLVPHLDPGHASLLSEILQRSTKMPVLEALDQIAVEPDHVYVVPPNRDMSIFHGVIHLTIPEAQRGQRMPIDLFLRSLADEQGEKSICVILSGTGSDGTLGLRAIHGAGGVSFIQDPSTAKYDGMPGSAVNSGLATYVLPVEKIPEQLTTYVSSYFDKKIRPVPPTPGETSALSNILMMIRSKTGNDLSLYKSTTINRRIERRRNALGIYDMNRYTRYMQENPAEIELLYKELLITVTSFFRDTEAFIALKKEVIPRLFEHKPENYGLRLWVPGCATGEEAYSLAMLLREFMAESGREYKVQIYGTDIDDNSIAVARRGSYPANIAIDLSAHRLKHFFIKEESGYRIKKEIREMIVFATQNITRDAPFTKLDMVSCRNLLIYLEPEMQGRLIPTFHYSLKPGGILFLGPSESIGVYTDLFAPVSRTWKIFRSKPSVSPSRAVAATGLAWKEDRSTKEAAGEVRIARETSYADLTRKVLLDIYAPCAVITDKNGTVLYIHGDTGKYLRPAPGQASLNIVEMAREGLKLDLRRTIQKAATQRRPVTCKDLQVQTDGVTRGVDLTAQPLPHAGAAPGLMLISFHDTGTPKKTAGAKAAASKAKPGRENELEQELAYTRENLQATIEEMQAANEELKSTNEEMQSTNEELQSTNEELETSKEELQSLNEELVTVNSEYQSKIEQLISLQNDLKNLLDTMNIATIFLDSNLSIRRFAREATKVYRLVASDVGRPLADIKSSIAGDYMVADALEVLDSLVPQEKEVQTSGGDWYHVRIVPYRTLDNVIDGVVLTFSEITALKRTEMAAMEARDYAESIIDTVREPLIVLDRDLRVISASRAFYLAFAVSPNETVGKHIYDLGNRQWDIPALRILLEKVLPGDTSFDDFTVEHEFPVIGHRRILLNARSLKGKENNARLILLTMEDANRGQFAPQAGQGLKEAG